MVVTFIVLSLLIIVVGYIINTIIKPKNFPPGPKWYPFIGSSNVVQNFSRKYGSQFKGFIELGKEYSTSVLGVKLGHELVVVTFGEKNARHVLSEKVFEGRPNSFFGKLRCLGQKKGITFTDGRLWKIHRQFTMTQLKNVGFGKTIMEREIQNELVVILEYLRKSQNKVLSPNSFISQAVMNVLWKYVAGEKINEDRWKHMQDLFIKRTKAFSMCGGLLNQFPWCRYFIPQISGYSLITNLNRQISEIIENAIEKHKNKEIEEKDFIYAFMEEMADHKETFTEDQLKVVCLDLLIAGSQTTGNLLEFAFLQLLRNKNVQDKICLEIDKVLGDDIPCWSDASRLTFTSAFMAEVQRWYNIVPLAGPRRALHDTEIDGYFVPKDTTVLISLVDVHFDPELWDDPHVFKPERFIDERGALKNSEHLYSFGLGRRRCPGDSLAKSFIFIVFVGILQRYRLECPNGIVPSDEPSVGLISSPKPYKAEFVPRKFACYL